MALSTARIHRVRGRPPLLAAGIKSLIHSHSSSVKSLGYVFSFIYPCYTTHEDFSDRLLEVPVFIPALGNELLLVTDITANVLFFTSHRGYRITSRPEGFAVDIALATPTLPRHGNRGFPLEVTDDFGHRVLRWDAAQHVDMILHH